MRIWQDSSVLPESPLASSTSKADGYPVLIKSCPGNVTHTVNLSVEF